MAKYTSYKAQIGVNRGAGITDASNLQAKETQEWSRLTDSFAQLALNDLQETGAKAGKELAAKTVIADKQITVTNPSGEEQVIHVPIDFVTPDYLGHTAKKNFDALMYKRYEYENETKISKIIGEAYLNAAEKRLEPNTVETELADTKQAYLSSLSPKFGELMGQYWDRTFTQKGLGYLEQHQKFIKADANKIFANDLASLNRVYRDNYLKNIRPDFSRIDAIYESANDNGAQLGELSEQNKQILKNNIKTADKIMSDKNIRKHILSTNEELSGTNLGLNNRLNKNRQEILKLFNIDGIRPDSVTLTDPKTGEKYILSRDYIDNLADNNLDNLVEIKEYIGNTHQISQGLNTKIEKSTNFANQYKENIINNANNISPNYKHMTQTDFRNYADTLEGRELVVNDYNNRQIKIKGQDYEPITTDIAYNSADFLTDFIEKHGELPSSVVNRFNTLLVSYDKTQLNDKVWGVLTEPFDNPNMSGRFDFEQLGLSKRGEEIAEEILTTMNNEDVSLRVAIEMAEQNADIDTSKLARTTWELYMKNSNWDSHNELSAEVHKHTLKIFKRLNIAAVGGYPLSQVKKRVFDKIEKMAVKPQGSTALYDIVSTQISKLAMDKKYNKSKVNVGTPGHTVAVGRKDKNWWRGAIQVALPFEMFYGDGEVDSEITMKGRKKALQIFTKDINTAGTRLSDDSKKLLASGTMSFDSVVGLKPESFRSLNDSNFKEKWQPKNPKTPKDISIVPNYYWMLFNEEKGRWEYAESEKGELYILTWDDMQEMEIIE